MNQKKVTLLYILLHVVFWCTYAIAWSYTAVYLKACGYDNTIVGLVTGIGAVISVLLQPVLASMTQRFGWLNNRTNILLLKGCSLVFTFIIMLKLPGVYTIAVMFTMIAAIDASIPSILSSLAMDYVNSGQYINYGLARGCGSIAYAMICFVLGYVVEGFGTDCLMVLYLMMGLVTMAVTAVFPFDKEMKQKKEEKRERKKDSVLKRYAFLPYFLIASVLLFMGHNMSNVFLVNIIERAGGSSANLGLALAIAAGVELPVMVLFVRLSQKIKVEKLLVISAVFFTIKSLCTLFAVSMWMIYVVQFLQFGAFALFTPASVYFINKAMNHKDCGLGQALLGSCSLGLGGTLGNVLGGLVLDLAGVDAMIWCMVVLSAVGVLFMWIAEEKVRS